MSLLLNRDESRLGNNSLPRQTTQEQMNMLHATGHHNHPPPEGYECPHTLMRHPSHYHAQHTVLVTSQHEHECPYHSLRAPDCRGSREILDKDDQVTSQVKPSLILDCENNRDSTNERAALRHVHNADDNEAVTSRQNQQNMLVTFSPRKTSVTSSMGRTDSQNNHALLSF